MTPRRILRLLGTRDQRVFVLGVNEERITILSQQTRALNLVNALDSAWSHAEGSHRLRGARVVVVGGGAAAATTATAAACLGANVTLLADEDLLAVQRRAAHRYLHPFLYEWPARGWKRTNASLPILDWDAADGTTVADGLAAETRAQAQRLGFDLCENVLPSAVDIDSWTNAVTVRTRDAADVPIEIHPEIVILGVGFGREARHPNPPDGVYWNSYWEDDDLHTRTGRILVSGHGDGGLTEVLRCLIDRFDHRMVVELGQLVLRDIVTPDQILQFELDLADDAPRHGTRHFYDSLVLPQFEAWITPRLKRDTNVVLACRGEPLQRGSAPLNRLLVAQIAKLAPEQVRLDHRAVDVGGLRTAVGDGKVAPFDVPWADGDVEPFDVVAVRHGTVIPRPLDRYSGSFPPVLSNERVREPLGWALDLTRFQWWGPSTFSHCRGSAQSPGPPAAGSAPLVAPGPPSPSIGRDHLLGELAGLPERDATAALLIAIVAWAGEAGMRLSSSVLARAAAAQGESLDAVTRRIATGGDERAVRLLDESWSWTKLGISHDTGWSTLRALAREILILDVAGRRSTGANEETLLGALLASTDGPAIDDVRAADAYRRARPNDAAAALAVHNTVWERRLGHDSRAASLALHALQRAARLGADGNESARRALVLLAWEEIEPTLDVGGRHPGLADRARNEIPVRAGAGAMLLALADPVTPDVVSRLVYGGRGVVSLLQQLDDDFDEPVDKALAFAQGVSAGWHARWARGFARTLYLARLRRRLGWPRRPPSWDTLTYAMGGEYNWMAALTEGPT